MAQHSSQTAALRCHLGFICYTFGTFVLLGAERTFKHTAGTKKKKKGGGSALLKVTWKQEPTHLSFPSLLFFFFFQRASACMVLTKGHSSQKHEHFHRRLSSFLLFSGFFLNKQNSLAEETKRDTFGGGKT